eukprot:Gb_04544 [translate_table: standard]
MECNREEALRAKAIAEKKFIAHDVQEGYKFAQKAYRLYPELEGLSQMLSVMEVHLAADTKLSGLMDWYAVLQVGAFSDHALIKKQYKKLALVLHPDKNKCLGAEGAFKLIGEAWGVLSDRLKRNIYDHMRRSKIQQPLNTPPADHPSPNVNSPSPQQEFKAPPAEQPTPDVKSSNGGNNFTAAHMPSSKTPTTPSAYQATPKVNSSEANNSPTAAHRTYGKTPTFWTACSSCNTLHEYERSFERNDLVCPCCQNPFLAVEVATMSVNEVRVDAKKPRKSSRKRKNSTVMETKTNALDKEIHHKKREKHAKSEPKKARKENNESKNTNKKKNEPEKPKKLDSVPLMDDPSVKIVDPVSIDVQDSDFHDFDKDRTENCFEENQIWAVYDNDDGMPRYYAFINNVVSLKPFKVHMSWLEGKDNGDQDLIKWAKAGFWRTCGDFIVGRRTTTEFLNVFSHVMRSEKAPGGVVKIFPKKGEIWALYRDWRADWDDSTPQEVRQKYEMVEIITDFTETLGASVVPLVKLSGFKTLFQKKQIGSQAVQWVLKTEILRFSHQVPARRLSGNEAANLPKGCWELDPAATAVGLSEAS